MSYVSVTPDYYKMLQPDGPWGAGSPGWSRAPVPGWGQNPNRVGPPRQAVNGLGCSKCPPAIGAEEGGKLGTLAFVTILGLSVVGFVLVTKELKEARR